MLFAVSTGNLDITQVLLQAGADPLQAANDGRTAIHIAETEERTDILGALNEHLKPEVINAKTVTNELPHESKSTAQKESKKSAEPEKKAAKKENAQSKAEISKLSRERAAKEKYAREQAEKEESLYSGSEDFAPEIEEPKKKPAGMFSMFGM